MPNYPRCQTCGASIAKPSGRGRPSSYCAPPAGETRSDCKRYAETLAEVKRLAKRIVSNAPSASRDRARRTVQLDAQALRDVVIDPR